MTPEQAQTLGKIEQKIDDFVINNSEQHVEMNEQLRAHATMVDEKLEKRLKSGLFYWVMSGVFTCLLILGGLNMDIKWDLEHHMDKARQAFHSITGEPYVTPENLKR